MEIIDEKIIVDLSEQDDFLPFYGNIEETFSTIEEILDENGLSNKKLQILENISNVLDYLAGIGNVHEKLVFDTAQLYLMQKYVNLDSKLLKKYFSKYAVAGAKVLSEGFENTKKYIEQIFENRDFLYLSKIKIADYIFEAAELSKENKLANSVLLDEIQYVIDKYGSNSQQGLMNKLKSIVE